MQKSVPSSLQSLSLDNIDLWSINPSALSAQSVVLLSHLLSAKESQDLLQYKHKQAHRTALVTRAICRLVLSHYTLKKADELIFIRDQHGKPELANNDSHIRFNLSHNPQQVIMAVCVKDDIGCDIEDPKRNVSIEPITRRYFSKQEHHVISSLQGESQKQRFFAYWTLKEAFVKATGLGISLGLNSFYFNFDNRLLAPSISVHFNDHYRLDTKVDWQCYQQPFEEQLIAICRASNVKQQVNYLSVESLFTNTL